jgi:tRNA threonylcarbamoyl adenosine modification protein YeaZ
LNLLAIDTSSHLCSACLYNCEADQVLASHSVDIGRGHAEILMELIEKSLQDARLDYGELNRIAVTNGPGSFTGVRVGMAVARGFSLSMDIPCIGISTLDACEAKVVDHKGDLITLLDAKRGQLYYKIRGEKPAIATCNELDEALNGKNYSSCGAGASILNEHSNLALPVLHTDSAPEIERVARLAAQRLEGSRPPEPLYLREADAKVQTGFALDRA